MSENEEGFVPLFDGESLEGWVVQPRLYGEMYPGGPDVTEVLPVFPSNYNELSSEHPATWEVHEGSIVGVQESPGIGWGGYLVTEEKFGDFELRLEMKPDWPADTGVMIRRKFDSWAGLQVLVDHRQSGSIGGFFGNGIGGFHAVPFALDVERDDTGEPVGLVEDNPETSVEPFSPNKSQMLEYSGQVTDFLDAWKWADWNTLTIRCVGLKPRVTTWVNDVKVAEIDLSTLVAENYDADAVANLLTGTGHIALEVHDNDPMLGEGRWAPGAACRWRNIRIKKL